jgi:hypothetical protein
LPPDVLEGIRVATEETVSLFDPFTAAVSGQAILGPDKASVLLLESPELVEIRQALCGYEAVKAGYLLADKQFPWWVIHLTCGYTGELPVDPPGEIAIDGLGIWVAEEKQRVPLGGEAAEDDPFLASVLVPPVLCLDDLAPAVQYADTHPAARWYMQRRAVALGAAELIPAQWAASA